MPLVSRTFDQLIDFTRTSAATFVNSSGNIASTPQSRNLLTFTQEFDNAAWTKTDTTVTANNVAAPDGTQTADTLTEGSAGTGQVGATGSVSAAGATATFSIYLKRGNTDWVRLQVINGANGFRAWFNLNTGAVGTSAAVGSGTLTGASIVNAGNGWYRCIVTGAIPAVTAYSVFTNTASADNSGTRVSGGTYLAWGAQLEQASAATDYTRNFGGLFPPRFDYDPVTLAPRGLLIEEQRTNLLTYSEQFDNAAWTKTGTATITANSTTAPDGTSTADTFFCGATAASELRRSGLTVAATAHTYSIFAKKGVASFIIMQMADGAGNFARQWFNLDTGVAGTVTNSGLTITSTSITPFGNGWYRCAITATFPSAISTATVNNFIGTSDGGFGGDATSTIFLWGAQLEAGAFATSYIPTVASQVTRTADTALIQAPNFAPWYRADEGTLLVEWGSSTTNSLAVANLSDGTTNTRITVQNDNGFQGAILVGGAVQASLDGGTIGAINKVAFAFKANDFALSLGGGAAVTDASGSMPTVDRLILGANGAGSASFLNGHIRSIRYYPVRLSNAQLQALTA